MRRFLLLAALAAMALACGGLPDVDSLTKSRYTERVVEVEEVPPEVAAAEPIKGWYAGMDPIACRDCDLHGVDAIGSVDATTFADEPKHPHGPELAFDRDPTTAWCATGGEGEWIDVAFEQPVDLQGLALLGGWFTSEYELFRHQRAAEVLITADTGPAYLLTIEDAARGPDKFGPQRDQPVIVAKKWTGVRSMRLEFRDTFEGRDGLGLCVSSIDLYGAPSR